MTNPTTNFSAHKKTFFASDFHLGVPDFSSSRNREKRIVNWLDSIKEEAESVYLVGDLFDFWFEYKKVVPRGFTRLLGKLGELSDSGIKIHIFHGNHDMWQFGYLEEELGCEVHNGLVYTEIAGKKFCIAHGDGLGPEQRWFKFILSIYRNRFFQRLFGAMHPLWGIGMAEWFSNRSKEKTAKTGEKFMGNDKEYLIRFANEQQKIRPVDFYVFGHRHLALDIDIGTARVINLGDWFTKNTCAVFDNQNIELKIWDSPSA